MNEVIPIVEDKRQPTAEPYTGPERRADWHTPADCFRLLETQERLDKGSERMQRIEDSIAEVKAAQVKAVEIHARFETKLDGNSTATAEILEIISTAKGFFKVASMIGNALKWVLGIATAVIAFVVAIQSGGK